MITQAAHRNNFRNSRLLLTQAFIVSITGLLSSCSTLSVTYDYADWILYWKVDQYFDVSPEQESLLENRLNTLHSWHRKEEIPRYVSYLKDIHQYWQDGLTHEEVDQTLQRYETLRNRFLQRLASDSAVFLATVNTQQVQHLEHRIQVENQKLLTRIGIDADERRENRVTSALDWLHDWLGDISSHQEHLITNLVARFPDTTQAWLQFRTSRQRELLTFLRSKPQTTLIKHKVHDWLVVPEKDAPSSFIAATQKRKQSFKATILAIDRLVTPEQRLYASQRLEVLIQELEEMTHG